jgi:diacylglycerol kinase family enzyme
VNTKIRIIANGGAKGMITSDDREAFNQLVTRELSGAQVIFAELGENVQALARSAIAEGATVVVAGGGDGTVNAIASVVVGTDIVLGVLPLGTLNHFAKNLGLPAEIDGALRILAAGKTRAVDVGAVNNRIFVNNSGLGLYPDVVHSREQRHKRGAIGWTAAFAASVKALFRYRVLGIRVFVNGEQLLRHTPSVFIGNNEYTIQGFLEPTRTRLDAGVLCLYIPHPRSRLKFIWFAVRALFGKSRPDSDFDMTLTDALTIESRHHHLRVSLDGEVTSMTTPLKYSSRHNVLRVIVPDRAG